MHEDPAKSAARRRLPTEAPGRTRYVVGIDLGTTNTALAWVDRRSGRKARTVRSFEVAQLVAPGVVEARRTLPSAVYLRAEHELSPVQVALPWDAGDSPLIVGELARRRGALVPDRLIVSAKSWLCHPGVDRTGPILPWGAPDDVPRRSPVEVQAAILRHLREAWDSAHAQDEQVKRLAAQELVVTVPASFDEAARELTVQASRQAGLDVLLIEEPQAALYAWIAEHEEDWRDTLRPGQTILVCDVGGGTSDFSLIRVNAEEDEEAAGFERVAVGDHLLLGGDNMDLALARQVEARLGRALDLRAWNGLVQACRDAKERLLEGEPGEVAQVAVAGGGSKLIGGTVRAEIGREEVVRVVAEGFFPPVAPDEPLRRATAAGLREFGLPYETDPAITRHLRAFLAHHAPEGQGLARVDHVLFNGGVFRTRALRERVLEVLGTWQERPSELASRDLDLAVAHGAAYYGLVRRGRGTRIKSGAGRSYYVEVHAPGSGRRAAICLIPRGLEEGAAVTITDHPLEVQANRPVVFPFHSSTVRDDPPGAVVALDPEEFGELAPLHTVIRLGRKRATEQRSVPVQLVARYTELGTLEMWCQARDGERRWRLELDTRPRQQPDGGAAAAADEDAEPDVELPPAEPGPGVSPEQLEQARELLRTALSRPAAEAQPALERLGKELEAVLGGAREGWPVPVIRALFDALMEAKELRRRSDAHEARWLNLAGFCIRPGFGGTLDPPRVQAFWRIYLEGLLHPKRENVRLEWTVAFRRASGGLNRGQQETLFSKVEPVLLGDRGKGVSRQEMAEYWRLAGSLEELSPKKKRRLGEHLLELLEKGKAPPRWGPWALGRLGGRTPLYGPLDRLVSADTAAGWVRRLLRLGPRGSEAVFALVQLARLTGDRSRDLGPDLREEVRTYLVHQGVEPRALRPLEEVVVTEVRDQGELLGDTLPIGLVLQAG